MSKLTPDKTMTELTQIQKDIEARNVQMGRKLLAYEVMFLELEVVHLELTAWFFALPDDDLRDAIKARATKVHQVIRKVKGETP